MHARRLNRIARFLGSNGFYKEAYQIKKLAQTDPDDTLEIVLDKEDEDDLSAEHPSAGRDPFDPFNQPDARDPGYDLGADTEAERINMETQDDWIDRLLANNEDEDEHFPHDTEDDFQEPEDDDSLSGSGEVKWESKY